MSECGCDCSDRNRQAVFELKTQWGAGHVDMSKILSILEAKRD